MRAFPMIPTFLMLMICIALIIVILKSTKKIRHILIVILLFLLNQRFMIPTESATATSNNVDVLFIIDNTISMNAEDYNGNEKRLDGVKKDCTKIIKELNGARFGIITFDNKARILIPFTKDYNMAQESIDIIDPIGEWYARGSSLNTPLEDIENVLKNNQQKSQDRIQVVFFISDGEITDGSKLNSYSSIKKYIQEGAVLGYGTKKGGIMHYVDQYDNSQNPKQKVIMDKSSYPQKEALSKIDESNLKSIASDLNIDYIHMDKSSKIDSKIKSIKNIMEKDNMAISITSYDDTYYFIAPIILVLLVFDFKKARRECA